MASSANQPVNVCVNVRIKTQSISVQLTCINSPIQSALHVPYVPSPLSQLIMSLPDFMTNPNAVLGDTEDEWRYGRIPDYNKVNAAFEKGKICLAGINFHLTI